MAINRIVVLVGGVGGAKLAYGLAQVLAPEALSIVVNVGDDFSYYGLHISPDIDTIMYTLSGLVNRTQGWGVADDTRHMLDMLSRYGEAPWFGLGDRDLATHLLRTTRLQMGQTLTNVTAGLSASLGVPFPILPVTDQPLRTVVDTVDYGELEFQEYFVRYRWQPLVRHIRFAGADAAQMTPQVRQALHQADVVLIAPSNPWLSIDPILAVAGVRDLLCNLAIPRVAITPIIGGKAVKGPAAKLMAELGYQPSPIAVAQHYGPLITGYVSDQRDPSVELAGLRTTQMDTLMQTEADRVRLARDVLHWIGGI